jgi:Ca2+-binding EF-hand superfamily protein
MAKEELNFEEFKLLVKPPSLIPSAPKLSAVHDVPVLGLLTSALADNLNSSFGLGNASDEELRAAFKRMDTDGSGTLDKGEIAEAMRGMGKSEREIQKLVSAMPSEEMTFVEFRDLLRPKKREMLTTTTIGGVSIKVPNIEKIHDVPLVGAVTGLAAGALSGALDAFGNFGDMSDSELKAVFDKIDTDRSGLLDKKEIGQALREAKKSERDIKQMLDRCKHNA